MTKLLLYLGLLVLGFGAAKLFLQAIGVYLSFGVIVNTILYSLGKPTNILDSMNQASTPFVQGAIDAITPIGAVLLIIGILVKLFYWGIAFSSRHFPYFFWPRDM